MYQDRTAWWESYALPKLRQVYSVVEKAEGELYQFNTKTFGTVTIRVKEDYVRWSKRDEVLTGSSFDIPAWFKENIFSKYKTSWRDMRELKSRFENEVQRCVMLTEIRINVRDGWLLVSNESSFGSYSAIKQISDTWLQQFCNAYRLTWTRDDSLGIFISSYYSTCDA